MQQLPRATIDPYEITSAGQEVLAAQLAAMQQIVRVARGRTATAFGM